MAGLYRGLAHGFVIDQRDAAQAREIEALGLACRSTETLMRDPEIARGLAETALGLAHELGRRR